jgi:hypothetical protein
VRTRGGSEVDDAPPVISRLGQGDELPTIETQVYILGGRGDRRGPRSDRSWPRRCHAAAQREPRGAVATRPKAPAHERDRAGEIEQEAANDVREADRQPDRALQQMVCKWRQRFVADRLDGLADEPRPGAPRRIGDEQIEVVLVATLETPTSMLASLVSRPAKSSTSTPSPEVGH